MQGVLLGNFSDDSLAYIAYYEEGELVKKEVQ
jgi:hypothetical protein